MKRAIKEPHKKQKWKLPKLLKSFFMVHLYFFENVTRDFNRLMSILLYTENHSKGAPVARVNELRPKDFTQRFQTLWSVNRGKSWTSAQRDIQQIFLRKQLLHLPLLLLYAKWALGMRSFLQLLQLLLRNLRSSGIIFEKLACQARQNTRLFFGEEFRYKTNDSSLMLKKKNCKFLDTRKRISMILSCLPL